MRHLSSWVFKNERRAMTAAAVENWQTSNSTAAAAAAILIRLSFGGINLFRTFCSFGGGGGGNPRPPVIIWAWTRRADDVLRFNLCLVYLYA